MTCEECLGKNDTTFGNKTRKLILQWYKGHANLSSWKLSILETYFSTRFIDNNLAH